MNGARRAAARERHPVSAWHPDLERMRRRLADQLRSEGHPTPEQAATVLTLRGRLGLTGDELASVIGVDALDVAALETGARRAQEVRAAAYRS